jgi:glyoxylase-like metal-dependent hydrolase (beta-lactamase superfamily II)
VSEPKTVAPRYEEVAPGILHWTVQDNRIDFRSDCYAIVERGRTILIDPLPLAESYLDRLGTVTAICLTGSCHQRSAWRYRRRFGARVHAPVGAAGLDERPDVSYHDRDKLPGGLTARHTPGPTEVHYSLLHSLGGGALFCADILLNRGHGQVEYVPDEFQDNPARTRSSAARFLELSFATLCFAHGEPITRRTAVRDALRRVVK